MADDYEDFDAELLFMEYLENIGPERRVVNRRNHFEVYDDHKFVERYRLSKGVVLKVLEEIEHRLEYPTNRNHPLTPIEQLLLTLRFYATGTFQIVMADGSGVSHAACFCCKLTPSVFVFSITCLYVCNSSTKALLSVFE